MDILKSEKLNKQKIMDELGPFLEITTWNGMKYHLRVNKYPLRYESNRPFIFRHELKSFIEKLNSTNLE